jgi:hypothetical protein
MNPKYTDAALANFPIPEYAEPKTKLEETLFPLLRKVYREGVQKGYNLHAEEVTQAALAEAFKRGAEAMADQVSEDYLNGRDVRPAFENPYDSDQL